MAGVLKYNTGSGQTEFHGLSGSSLFQTFDLHVATPIPLTDHTWQFGLMDYNGDGILDWVAIDRTGSLTGTTSGHTDIHILDGATNATTWLLSVSTLLPPTDENWVYLTGSYNGRPALYCINRAGPSGHTELYILSGG